MSEEAINNLTAAINNLAEVLEQQSFPVRSYTYRQDKDTSPAISQKISASRQVRALVKTLLKDGPQPSSVIEAAVKEAGIVCAQWQRAANKIARPRHATFGAPWVWELETTPASFDA